MPLCSGKVTVPLGCSTALVMNRRPGHAPQLPPPVDALAGMAAAMAGMAIAMTAIGPSAALTNLILRNLVIFTGCPFLRGCQPGRWPRALAVSLTPVGVRGGADLTSPRPAHQSAADAGRRPSPWPQRGRPIPRRHEAGKDQARADQDSQEGRARAGVALACRLTCTSRRVLSVSSLLV